MHISLMGGPVRATTCAASQLVAARPNISYTNTKHGLLNNSRQLPTRTQVVHGSILCNYLLLKTRTLLGKQRNIIIRQLKYFLIYLFFVAVKDDSQFLPLTSGC